MLDRLKQALQEQFQTGIEPKPDFPSKPLTGVYWKRQIEIGIAVCQFMGIARDDKEKREQWMLKIPRAFDAPNMIILSMDREISDSQPFFAIFSPGMTCQTIALAALEFGLGTCIERLLVLPRSSKANYRHPKF